MLKEILDAVLYGFPDWAMLALLIWEKWRHRRRKYKRSDGRREDA